LFQLSLDAKLLGKRPPSGFPGGAVAGLLDYAGNEGWELVSLETHETIVGDDTGIEMIFVFKRPIK